MNLRTPRVYHRRQVYKTGRLFNVGPTTLRYLVLVLLATFSLLYLVQSAQGADKAIELNTMDKKKAELDQELTTLEVNASRLQSLQNLSQSAAASGLVPIDNSAQTLNPEP